MSTILVTGGCGFIGSCFIRQLFQKGGDPNVNVINIDKLTYAGHEENLPEAIRCDPRYRWHRTCITNRRAIAEILSESQPDAIVHFAAESHVDRSISSADPFVSSNVVGTVTLLDESLAMIRARAMQSDFRFIHISTDEVYGSLGKDGCFTESSPQRPSSPYAASKAAAEMFVRAYQTTHSLPTIITHCSNNYGPYQHPEKLIPLMILRAARGQSMPVYSNGSNIRDWLHVTDHCDAIARVLQRGRAGQTYHIGGHAERTNIDVVQSIADAVDERLGRPTGSSRRLIEFVDDRPGHDYRYALDSSKTEAELNWRPAVSFESGLMETIDWYLAADDWITATASNVHHG